MKNYINIYVFSFTAKKIIQNLIMVQEGGKKKLVCKNRKCSVVLDGNLNVYLLSDRTNFWILCEL